MSSFFAIKFSGEAFITLLVITDPPGVVPPVPRADPWAAGQGPGPAGLAGCGGGAGGHPGLRGVRPEGAALPRHRSGRAAGRGRPIAAARRAAAAHRSAGGADRAERARTNVAFVPLGTPHLAGPGAIVATMLFVWRAQTGPDLAPFLAAILAVTVVLWLVMRFSGVILGLLRTSGVELVTRIAACCCQRSRFSLPPTPSVRSSCTAEPAGGMPWLRG